jgi:hypothetical protein
MSWMYIVLGVAIVVLLINVAIVFMLRAWHTDVGPEHENH